MTLSVRYASAAGRDAALKTGMVDGMSGTYDRLEEMMARGEIGSTR
jgi:hypothetical protein